MQKITDLPSLPERKIDAHKGDFGKVCIIGSSIGFSGAGALAAKSALRSGSGLVRLAVPKSVLPIVSAIEPCYTTISLDQDSTGKISIKAIDKILTAAHQNDIIAFGMGIGISSAIKDILRTLLALNIRLVIDADGLNNLAKIKNWPDICTANIILTPHSGEMKRLYNGLIRGQMPTDRQLCGTEFAKAANATIVLKGHQSIVCNTEKIYINTTGNCGMATAGSGDVLTGVITALAGQGLNDFEAAVLGVYIHGSAGDAAAQDKGQISLIATDIIDCLPNAFKKIQKTEL